MRRGRHPRRVKTAGCSGLTYTIDFAREIGPGEEVIEADGVKVVIDPQAMMYLLGTEMDFVEDPLGAAFKFNNPNEAGRCGCGEIVHGIAAEAARGGACPGSPSSPRVNARTSRRRAASR